MQSRTSWLPLLALAVALVAAPATAQVDDAEFDRFSLAIGGGLVDTDLSTEPYFMGAFRIRIGGYEEEDGRRVRRGGVSGYVEPEIGYWSGEGGVGNTNVDRSDLLLGANIGGAIMLRSVEYFVGAGVGLHFFDADVDRNGIRDLSDSEEAVGVNIQFGVDVYLTDSFSLFGSGRVDLIEDIEIGNGLDDDRQTKVYLGGRFHF